MKDGTKYEKGAQNEKSIDLYFDEKDGFEKAEQGEKDNSGNFKNQTLKV